MANKLHRAYLLCIQIGSKHTVQMVVKLDALRPVSRHGIVTLSDIPPTVHWHVDTLMSCVQPG